MKVAQIDAPYAISTSASSMVTLGDLGDLERSTKQFRLLQPSYNSGTTGPISVKMATTDAPYAMSSGVLNMVTLCDLVDLEK